LSANTTFCNLAAYCVYGDDSFISYSFVEYSWVLMCEILWGYSKFGTRRAGGRGGVSKRCSEARRQRKHAQCRFQLQLPPKCLVQSFHHCTCGVGASNLSIQFALPVAVIPPVAVKCAHRANSTALGAAFGTGKTQFIRLRLCRGLRPHDTEVNPATPHHYAPDTGSIGVHVFK
jgi:hypothetical protein